ncbi:MAG: hypothetical protein IKF36_01270 [Bacilli bacterium]|nr:hypothetical protein [Bacilli bacterium]
MTNEEYIEKKIANDKKHRKRVMQVKGLKGLIIGTGLLLGLGGIGTAVIDDKEHLSYSEIIEEMDIHSGHGITPDGKHIEPSGHYGCDIPDDGEEHVYFTDRLIQAMSKDYSPEVIRETAILFPQMCGSEYKEAKEQLEEIEASLVMDEDGKYYIPVKKAAMK